MIESALLFSWALSGGLAAWSKPEPDTPRLAWAPVAVFFGPLWLAVANDRQLNQQVGQAS